MPILRMNSHKPRVLFTTATLPRWDGDPQPRFILDAARASTPWITPELLAPSFRGAKSSDDQIDGVARHLYRYAPAPMETLAYNGGIPTQLRINRYKWLLVPGLVSALYLSIKAQMRRNRYDAVLANWILPQGIVQSFIPGTPFFLYLLGADAYTLNSALIRKLKERALQKATHIFSVSRAMRDRMIEQYPRIPAEKYTILPTGVDTNKFCPARRAACQPGETARPIFLFVGRLDYKKGAATLIRAFHTYCADSGAPGSLMVVGSGPLEGELKRLASSGAGRERIIFHGPAPHSELPAIMASADIFCCPSTVGLGGDREGRPTVLPEAGACGLPLLGSRIEGIDEFIEDELNGWMIPAEDPLAWATRMRTLAERPDLRQQMGAKARLRAMKEDWQLIGEILANTIISKSQHKRATGA